MFLYAVIAVILIGLPLAGLLYQFAGKCRDRRRFPPLGRLIRVNGRGFHVLERGSGPSVVLESGIAGTSLSWTLVRDELAARARVLSYDRAGLGWSDPPREPRTLANAVDELHLLLEAVALPRPYVLVGHSYGGLIVRQFASAYPKEVAGLVLVDPVESKEWLPLSDLQRRRLARGVLLSRRGALLARFGIVRFALFLLISGGRRLPRAIARLSAGKGASVTERLTGEVRKLPPEMWPMVRMHWSDPKCFKTMADYLERLPENVAIAVATGFPSDVPTILLTAHDAHPTVPAGVVHRPSAKSGHWLQLDEPELVINAVLELLHLPTQD
jgi:pimeloyl-ACP methyl ester carboxylesterase